MLFRSTLLEKLIDAKDFYIETEISYSKNKATISVNDNNIFEKLKKARGEDFIFYYPENVNKNKKLHEWDEDRRNSKDNFFGKLDRQFDANKKEFTFTLSDEFKKEFTNNENSEIISSALDDLNFAMKARQFIEEKVTEAQKVYDRMVEAQKNAQALALKGSYGFFAYKDKDNKALDILEDTKLKAAGDKVAISSYTEIGNEDDATSLENMKLALESFCLPTWGLGLLTWLDWAE